MTKHETVGDDVADALAALRHVFDAENYDQLSVENQAYLQEAAHFLELVQN